jgi:hypothetical protein
MKNSPATCLARLCKLAAILFVLVLASPQTWGGDVGLNIVYTQYAYGGIGPSIDAVYLQYTFATNTLSFTANTPLISTASDPNFLGGDGIVIDSNNDNFLVAGGGGEGNAGSIYQITQTGAEGNPFDVTMTPGTTAYTAAIVPANGTNSGFPAGSLISTEKDFGYGRISIFPISPNLAAGTSYPVNGDDVTVTSVAFSANGTAYYGSGTESSNAGTFGTITFDGTQFLTHRLFGPPVGSDPRGGVIYTGTHRVSFDPFTGDIFTAGGNTIGQYDPSTNLFHILPVYGPADNFELQTPANDGNGHVLVTACCGLAGDSANGAGDLIIVDYSSAPGHVIDAASGVSYTYTFLTTNLASVAIIGSGSYSGQPLISQQPQSTSVLVGQTATFTVSAVGANLAYQWQIMAPGSSSFTNIPGATSSSYTTSAAAVGDNGTQFLCVVSNSQGTTPTNAATLTVFTTATKFITSTSLGTIRNNYSGWVGMSITVGASSLTVTSLGRMFAAGNSGTHTVKIVYAATGNDIPGASVSVSMSGGTPGQFVYANLPGGITLSANTSYYILTQETAGGDEWYDWDTTAQTTSVASLVAAEYGLPYSSISGSSGHLYGPVDFQYGIIVSQPAIAQQPQSQTVSVGSTATFSVTASGGNLSYQWSSAPSGSSTFTAINGATGSSYTTAATTLGQSGTQYMCVVSNSAGPTPSNAATLTVVASLPSTNYVTSFTPGTARNNFTGWVGMSITVGSSPVTVTALGRIVVSGNTGSHTMKIVNAANSEDVTGSSVSVPTSGGTAGTLAYANLASSVTLSANTTYYIMSQEASGGDSWYDVNTAVQTTSVAVENAGVYSYDGASYSGFGSANQSYGPVGFLYSTAATKPVITQEPQNQTVSVGSTATFSVTASGGNLSYQWSSAPSGSSTFTAINGATGSSYTTAATTLAQSGTQYMCVVSNSGGPTPSNAATLTVVASLPSTNYVTSFTPGTARNNFTGWVGMSITVGSSPVTVTALGRIVVSGNTGSHTMKIVNAANSEDVTGSSVSVPTSGGTAGTLAYANLASSVTLSANTTYYIMSQEASGGDSWYDVNTAVQTTSVAVENGGIYSYDGASYSGFGSANQSYGPVGFLYSTAVTQPVITQEPQNQTVSVGSTATFSVTASGGNLSYQWSSAPSGSSTFTAISGATGSSYTTAATTLAQSGTQYMCVVSNSAGPTPSNAATLTVVASLPSTNYITSFTPGTARNNFTGWVGMSITVGSSPVTVTALGRIVVSGNTGSHTMKIVNAANSEDVTGSSVSVPTSGGTAGTLAYANLASSVTLSANTTYYIMSQEASGGDSWYDVNTAVQTTSVAVENGGIYSYDGASYSGFGSANQSYGPVGFLYSTAVTQPVITQEPQNQTVSVGSTATFSVTASGGNLSYQWSSAPSGSSTFTAISGATGSSYTTAATTLAQSGTQYMCVVSNSAGPTPSNAATLTVTTAPTTTNFVTSETLGTLRNDFTGWVGMNISVGSSPLTVTALGRIVASGNTGSHTVKLVNASTGVDVPGGSVSVNTVGGTPNSFVYANLASPVTLSANTNYYIVSQETQNGDHWFDFNTTIVTTAVAADTFSVWGYNGSGYNGIASSSNHTYVPVDFVYELP